MHFDILLKANAEAYMQGSFSFTQRIVPDALDVKVVVGKEEQPNHGQGAGGSAHQPAPVLPSGPHTHHQD